MSEFSKETRKILDECKKLLDENVDALTELSAEFNTDSKEEEEDCFESRLQKHDLLDLVEDVATLSRLKKAEYGILRRQIYDDH